MSDSQQKPVKQVYSSPTLFSINPPGLEVPETFKFEEFTEEVQAQILGELIDCRQQLLYFRGVYPLTSSVKVQLLPSEFDKALFKLNLVLEILKRNA